MRHPRIYLPTMLTTLVIAVLALGTALAQLQGPLEEQTICHNGDTEGPCELATITPTPADTPTPTDTPAPTPTPTPSVPLVLVDDASFVVDLAVTPSQQAQGLSGRPPLEPGYGMLFVFEQPGIYPFWMPNMLFPLDMVWIGEDCRVVDITYNAPPPEPGQSLAELSRFRPDKPVLYVLEIHAGQAQATGIAVGDLVRFGGTIQGQFGCYQAAQLRPVDPEAIAPYLGIYEHPTLGEVELTLREGRLIFDTGELHSELRPLVDEAGQLAGYVFTDPPLAGPYSVVFRQGEDGQTEMVVTLPSEDPEEPLVYVFTLVEPASGLTRCAGRMPTITGTDGEDLINGTPGDDVIIGLGGDDTIYGHGGNDLICGGAGDDVLHGGYGSDGVHGGPGDDWVAGGWGELDGTDWVSGGPGDDVVYGGDADDSLWGGGGQDLLYGGTGNDNPYGNHRQDLLRGGLGDDSLFGGEGDDSLDGGADADFCDGGAGSNTITACEIITPAVDLARVQRELDENLKKWNSLGLTDYRFVYQRICFCLPKVTKPVIIEVRDGAMSSVVVEATGEAVDPSEWATYRTIEGIFQLLQDAIDQRAHDITVEYDQQYGFPRSSYIDYDVRIADEEQRVSARDLEPLDP